MDYYLSCSNTYNNISNRQQRSQTLQPIRGNEKNFIFNKYFSSQREPNLLEPERVNYANVPCPASSEDLLLLSHQSRRIPWCVHRKSLSGIRPNLSPSTFHVPDRVSPPQHLCHNTLQVPDFNNYYNITNMPATVHDALKHPSPINNIRAPPFHNHIGQLDNMTLDQVNIELGHDLDSPPPMPSPRHYSVIQTPDGCLYKTKIPHQRTLIKPFMDPVSGTTVPSGASVDVMSTSKEDRSKFTVYYESKHIDIPHPFTKLPLPSSIPNIP